MRPYIYSMRISASTGQWVLWIRRSVCIPRLAKSFIAASSFFKASSNVSCIRRYICPSEIWEVRQYYRCSPLIIDLEFWDDEQKIIQCGSKIVSKIRNYSAEIIWFKILDSRVCGLVLLLICLVRAWCMHMHQKKKVNCVAAYCKT
jgi:hypothetical protein